MVDVKGIMAAFSPAYDTVHGLGYILLDLLKPPT